MRRACKIGLKSATQRKQQAIKALLESYRAAVNFYCRSLWTNPGSLDKITLARLAKTRLSERYKSAALRQALAMVVNTRKAAKALKRRAGCPALKGAAILDAKFVTIEKGKGKGYFDYVLRLSSLHKGRKLEIPFKSTKPLNNWLAKPLAKLVQGCALIKPSLVDAKWSLADIGLIAVTVGTAMSLAGAFMGGVAHRALRERRALVGAALAQAAVSVPVILCFARGAPRVLTGVAIACEHFASGLGTTVLFAALMTATRRRDAGFHYTVLTSANALAIGLGGLVGGLVADHTSKTFAFALGGALCLAPLALIRGWDETARASAT